MMERLFALFERLARILDAEMAAPPPGWWVASTDDATDYARIRALDW